MLLCGAGPVAGQNSAQASAPDAGRATPWVTAIDAFVETGDPMAMVPLMHLSPDAVRLEARQAREAWRSSARTTRSAPASAARRLALRRMQAAALAPLEVLLPLSGLRNATPEWNAFEVVSREAWEALPELTQLYLEVFEGERSARDGERARLARFSVWWRVAYLQYLMNVTRLRDFNRQVALFSVDDDAEPRLRAEYAFLRGMVNERIARLSDAGPPGRALEIPVLGLRSGAVFNALSAAHTWYRHALRAMPAHLETQLHLGRILLEQRKPADALTILTPLSSDRCETVQCGTAWLFVGEAHEALGELGKAGAAYARASSVLGVRQSALLGLMHLAVRRGDMTAALGVSSQLAATSPLAAVVPPDAWSTYVGGRRLDGEAVLAPLRETQVR